MEKNGNEDYTIKGMDKEDFLKQEKEMAKMASYKQSYQQPYPSPYLSLSDTTIPESSRSIFQWCKYFFMFDPLISGAINALATFPITELHLNDISGKSKDHKKGEESDTLKAYKRVLFKNLNIHKLMIEIGIDYYLYGNCFIFGEMKVNSRTQEKEWSHMVRLDPSKMVIDYNPATQKKTYKWQVPDSIKRIVTTKQPADEYNKLPKKIKEAAIKNQAVVLNPSNVYHIARASDSMGDNVWGTPIIANVLKLIMYRNVLRQAQEAIAREHIVPMRLYYIERSPDYNANTNYATAAKNLAAELQKATMDPNYKVVSPVPVNMINVGGNGRSLLVTPEIQQIQEEILAGMNVPKEFIFGGVSYSGSSISLRILENQFITYRVILKDFLQNFVIKGMAIARGEWRNDEDDDNLVTVKMTDLKMQDDVQQKQLIFQLNGAGKCTDEFMWKVLGVDSDTMKEALREEAEYAIELESKLNIKKTEMQIKELESQLELQKKQMEINLVLQQYEAELQGQLQPQSSSEDNPEIGNLQEGAVDDVPSQNAENPNNEVANEQVVSEGDVAGEEVPEPQDGAPAGLSKDDQAVWNLAIQLHKLPEKYRANPLSKMPNDVRQKVVKAIQEIESIKKQEKDSEIDMRPMPEKLPPRRDSLK